jgi:hypothetical protein
MQVLLKSTDSAAETRCSVCGQGFAMFWERQTKTERVEALREIEATLRHHLGALKDDTPQGYLHSGHSGRLRTARVCRRSFRPAAEPRLLHLPAMRYRTPVR